WNGRPTGWRAKCPRTTSRPISRPAMGPIEHAALVTLGESDIAQAMALSQEAGWNQLPADWRLFIVHGRVFGVFDGPLLVATAAIIPYGDDFAWISMVLTRKAWRRRGLGVKLLKTCIA